MLVRKLPAYGIVIRCKYMTKTKTTHHLNIISYNLKYNRATGELDNLSQLYDADVLCVQECYSELLPSHIGKLELADKTKSNRLGLAIFFRSDRFRVLRTDSFPLQRGFHDRLFAPAEERLLVTKLYDNQSQQEVLIGSFHATPLTATNYIRRKQIATAHEILLNLSTKSPVIMVGDYNYPLFKRGLRVCIERSGYQLNRSDKPTYYMSKMIRGHFDLATSINTQIERVLTLPKGASDHAPILVQASL